jgi:hypothetical protein
LPIGILRGLDGAPLGARTTSILPSSIGNRDGEDFGLLIVKNGVFLKKLNIIFMNIFPKKDGCKFFG